MIRRLLLSSDHPTPPYLIVKLDSRCGKYLFSQSMSLGTFVCYLKDSEIDLDNGRFFAFTKHSQRNRVTVSRRRVRASDLIPTYLEWICENTSGSWSLDPPPVFVRELVFSFEDEDDACAFAVKFT
jgi:hypothetical protein